MKKRITIECVVSESHCIKEWDTTDNDEISTKLSEYLDIENSKQEGIEEVSIIVKEV